MNGTQQEPARILTDALEEYLEREWQELPPEPEIWKMHRFSAGFLRRMRELTGTRPAGASRRLFVRGAAGAAAVAVLAAGLWLGGNVLIGKGHKSADMALNEEVGQAAGNPETVFENGYSREDEESVQIRTEGTDWIVTIENTSDEAVDIAVFTAVYAVEDGKERLVWEAEPEPVQAAAGERTEIVFGLPEHGIEEPGVYRAELRIGEKTAAVWVTVP